jgi:hypothetical protein
VALIGERIKFVGTKQVGLDDIEQLAEFADVKLKPGNGVTIGAMLADIRASVLRKVASLEQDSPPAVFFDARP